MDQRDIVIRTVLGEAAGEGPEGWAAVANVLKNRAMDPRWPDEVGAVALQPQQFSAWNKGAGGNSLVSSYSPDDPAYQRVGQVVDAVFGGQIPDNTGGATHYYSPAGMEKLVGDGDQPNLIPRWLQEETERRGGGTTIIGGQIFTGLREGAPKQVAPSGQVAMPHEAQVDQSAQPGFTREQVLAALQRAEGASQSIAPPQQREAAPQMVMRQRSPGYQRETDGLTEAMRVFAGLQQKRKGLLA